MDPSFGEVWSYPGSLVQLIGLLVCILISFEPLLLYVVLISCIYYLVHKFLFLGTAIYDGRLYTCDEYEIIHETQSADSMNSIYIAK